MRLNGTYQLLDYADDVNILVGSIHTLKENAEALVAATREIGLEVRIDKTKYMVMSRDQNAVRNHSVRIDNNTFERVEGFKIFGNIFNTSKFYSGRNKEQIEVRIFCLLGCYPKI